MSSGMPELGSKISLISKADIRYEGRLFTVDPQECTIALANVRSFGTEDRDTQYPIAPQSQIYDYILFRGSDIKDIRVVNSAMPHPTDPAIMQMQLPNGQPMIPHFPIPSMNAPLANFGNPFGNMGNLAALGSAGLAPGSFMLSKPKQPNLLAGASRSTTPVSLISRKSPSADMAVQVNQNSHSSHVHDAAHKRISVPMKQGSHMRDRSDSGKDQQQDNRNNQRNQNQSRWIQPRTNNRGNRGRGRAPNQNVGYNNRQSGIPKGGRPKNTIKFEQDYDFEQANNKFEELRSQLSKLKVGDEAKSEQVNGETDKKDDSGNETGAGDHEQEEEEIVVGYDKTKSFFDNISCEAAADRTKGKNRTDWRQERKLNSETFGISSTRRGGGYHRQRGGGFYNRNMNHGGGYNNRGYRGGNYRNRNNNNNRTGQPTGLPHNKNQNNQQQPQQQPQQSQQQQQQQQPSQPQQPTATVAAGK